MIEIIEGHNPSSYFWIMPVKIKDLTQNTDNIENVCEYRELEISIEEENIGAYLFSLLLEFFDDDLEENKKRNVDYVHYNNPPISSTFEWYLTYNYYTFESIKQMIEKIKNIIYLLRTDYNNPKLNDIKMNYNWVIYFTDEYDNKKTYTKEEEDEIIHDNIEMIIDFYERFIKYMENMMEEGEKAGYKLISFMGP